MEYERYGHAMSAIGNNYIIVTGSVHQNYMSCELFNIELGIWTQIDHLE